MSSYLLEVLMEKGACGVTGVGDPPQHWGFKLIFLGGSGGKH
jgi:hypothetical protein